MAILQFAFGEDPQAETFKPHNYERALVAYTGTHDNDTVLGWWQSAGGADSTRTAAQVEAEKEHARRYLATDGSEMNWVLVRALLASVADTAIVPLQDVLGLGSEARMNRPATASGNWRWRVRAEELRPAIADRLRELVLLYGRGDSSNQ
jgi:4-alpha-glucanotransferase